MLSINSANAEAAYIASRIVDFPAPLAPIMIFMSMSSSIFPVFYSFKITD